MPYGYSHKAEENGGGWLSAKVKMFFRKSLENF